MSVSMLPVVVIGAGPIGLSAAAHLLERGLTPLIMEAGGTVGAGMLRWKHVRMFSPWEFNIDRAANDLLVKHGWKAPDLSQFPTGGDVVERYLRPLAATPDIQAHLRTNARVLVVTKQHRDRMKDTQRNDAPFLVRYIDETGEHEVLAQAVIDASGTIESPNPAGASGIPAIGECSLQDCIFYGIPDVLGTYRERYAGKRILVVGSGHSAFNVLSDLAQLSQQFPGMQIEWAIRRQSLSRILGGGEHDQLKERGRLGLTIGKLVEQGVLHVTTGFSLDYLEATAGGIIAHGDGKTIRAVDEIVASTGFRPDSSMLAELRISLDHGTQAPVALAPLIDPNQHSCGSVRPHGAEELKHPDAGVYIVGMKSYGRAPTFLLLTGYEQVRSVVAALAGDWEAARRVELALPETGVCITQFAEEDAARVAAASCCGTKLPVADTREVTTTGAQVAAGCSGDPTPAKVDAPCAVDAKVDGVPLAGCGPTPVVISATPTTSCCK